MVMVISADKVGHGLEVVGARDTIVTRSSVAIFGGTFDPIHEGHLKSINLLCNELDFTHVHWVLSARPPHKDQVSASIKHRFAMLQCALRGIPHYIADDTEISRQSKSYTIDTITTFRLRYPDANLIVIIGADSLLNLPMWHRYCELVEQVNWVVMRRPGYQLDVAEDLPVDLQRRFVQSRDQLLSSNGGALWLFEQTEFDVSSTKLRAELVNKPALDGLLTKQFLASDVIEYIRAHQLYKIAPMKPEQIKDQVVEALENIKGQDIKVIDIADISSFADYMIVASGTSDTHVKALAREASNSLRTQGVIPLNEDGADVGEWVLVDFGDVVLHVMRPEVREYYALEKLWNEDVRALVEKHRALDQE